MVQQRKLFSYYLHFTSFEQLITFEIARQSTGQQIKNTKLVGGSIEQLLKFKKFM